MLTNGACGGGGLGAVAVMVGVDSASGGGSVSTVLRTVLASMVKRHGATRVEVILDGNSDVLTLVRTSRRGRNGYTRARDAIGETKAA
jgi:hypothetical protein